MRKPAAIFLFYKCQASAQEARNTRRTLMSTDVDDEHEHISDDRLVEISKSTAGEFSDEERMHVTNCDLCRRLLGALFRLQEGD